MCVSEISPFFVCILFIRFGVKVILALGNDLGTSELIKEPKYKKGHKDLQNIGHAI